MASPSPQRLIRSKPCLQKTYSKCELDLLNSASPLGNSADKPRLLPTEVGSGPDSREVFLRALFLLPIKLRRGLTLSSGTCADGSNFETLLLLPCRIQI